MNSSPGELWLRFQKYYREYPAIGMSLDLSRVDFPDNFLATIEPAMKTAFKEMAELEKGAIANPDEKRMVGHYWLRNPALAPNASIRKEIEDAVADIKSFAAQIHQGAIKGAKGPFKNVLLIGIGGSALGPQFVANALGNPVTDKLKPYFFDNTDPDGMDKVLGTIGQTNLGQTLCIVVSKSGGTKETRNGMLEARHAYEQAGLDFERHAVAVTSAGSELDKYASRWLARFPMWDWVGGRTSELSAVGLLPAALEGIDIQGLLDGAKACDEITRLGVLKDNPSALLAAMWFCIGNGKGTRNMVVLPYKDRLELFSKYLQQLVMESLGKALDRSGNVVNQGITVLGNKGSTDQHSYIQQLRDGLSNFFVVFIQVLCDRAGQSLDVEQQVTSGDYLNGFLLGTRRALYENGRQSITITLRNVSAQSVGALIALFERTVGLYASLVNVNAYHQPGVEAGKKAAADVISLQSAALKFLAAGKAATAEHIASCIGHEQEVETIFRIMEHLAANPDRRIERSPGPTTFESTYKIS